MGSNSSVPSRFMYETFCSFLYINSVTYFYGTKWFIAVKFACLLLWDVISCCRVPSASCSLGTWYAVLHIVGIFCFLWIPMSGKINRLNSLVNKDLTYIKYLIFKDLQYSKVHLILTYKHTHKFFLRKHLGGLLSFWIFW